MRFFPGSSYRGTPKLEASLLYGKRERCLATGFEMSKCRNSVTYKKKQRVVYHTKYIYLNWIVIVLLYPHAFNLQNVTYGIMEKSIKALKKPDLQQQARSVLCQLGLTLFHPLKSSGH